MLELIVSTLFSTIIMMLSFVYMWNNIANLKNIEINNRNIIIFVICSLLATLNYLVTNDFIKPIFSVIILIAFCSCILGKLCNKSIILSIISQIIIVIAEIIYSLIIIMLFNANMDNMVNSYYGSIITNISISLIAVVISKIRYNGILYNNVVSITDRINKIHLSFVILIVTYVASFLTAFFYHKINLAFLLVFNLFVIIIYFVFIYNYLKTNNNYIKVYDKYNMTLNSLKEYEDILSRYRISNHENKNQLLTIRSMIKNKKVASYIDEIVENKIKDNEKLMFDSMVIPEGGLRGLIYSKMLLMKEKNIEFDLCVDKALKTTDLTVISDDLMFNICSIVGVYLDNAIEAVKELKEKYITIEIYLDDTLNIAITNNYEGNIDLDSIDKVGYSTKGGSHGYGLSLANEIISNNKSIKNNRSISDDEFTQEISVKYKK